MARVGMTRKENTVFPEIGRRPTTESIAGIGLEIDEYVPAEDNVARTRCDRKRLGDDVGLDKSDQGPDFVGDLPLAT